MRFKNLIITGFVLLTSSSVYAQSSDTIATEIPLGKGQYLAGQSVNRMGNIAILGLDVNDGTELNSVTTFTNKISGTTRKALTATTETYTGPSILFSTANTGVRENIGTLAALGSNQATCAPVVTTVARVTAADGSVGVCLPAITSAMLGKHTVVINSDVTNALKVYSAAAETITGQAGTTAISVAAKLQLDCWPYSTSAWYCGKSVLPY